MRENKTTRAKRSLHLKLNKKSNEFSVKSFFRLQVNFTEKQQILGQVLFSSREIDRKTWSEFPIKGGESSRQFRWFTIAKIEQKFLIFFVWILGLRLQRYSTDTKRCPPKKVFGNSEF